MKMLQIATAFLLSLFPNLSLAEALIARVVTGGGATFSRLSVPTTATGDDSRDYTGLLMPVLTAGLQLEHALDADFAVVGGAGVGAFGIGADAGHFKTHGSTIVYEGRLVELEAGVAPRFGLLELKATVGLASGFGGTYKSINKLDTDDQGHFVEKTVESDRRVSLHFRFSTDFGKAFHAGVEITPYFGTLVIAGQKEPDRVRGISTGLVLAFPI